VDEAVFGDEIACHDAGVEVEACCVEDGDGEGSYALRVGACFVVKRGGVIFGGKGRGVEGGGDGFPVSDVVDG
jgi:hypothetical protein